MAPRAPPLDARRFLDNSQKAELGRVPAPFRELGAWLILIRDDNKGEWVERSTSCIECRGQQIPCIDKTNPGTRRRCEGCSLGDLKCAPGFDPAKAANDAAALSRSFHGMGPLHEAEDVAAHPRTVLESKKRKRDRAEPTSGTATKASKRESPKRGSKPMPTKVSEVDPTPPEQVTPKRVSRVASSVPSPSKAAQSVIDLTSDDGDIRKAGGSSKASTGPGMARRTEGRFESSAYSDSSDSSGTSLGEAPQLRHGITARSRGWVSETKAPVSQTSSPTQSRRRPRSSAKLNLGQYPPAVGTLPVEHRGKGVPDLSLPTPSPAVTAAPAFFPTGSARGRFYRNDRIRCILDKARQFSRARVYCEVDGWGLDRHEKTRPEHEFTVAVRTPGKSSTWLVIVIDHKRQLGHVMLSASERHADGDTRSKIESTLRRAFNHFKGGITIEGVEYPLLDDTLGGSFYAAALAVAVVRQAPGLPPRELVIDGAKAEMEHSMLLDDVPRPTTSATLGATSRILARITRQDGRFQWL